MPSSQTLTTLINKRKFYESLTKKNIAHPKTHYPNNLNDTFLFVKKTATKKEKKVKRPTCRTKKERITKKVPK